MATSHESLLSITKTYPNCKETLKKLKHLNATVLHEIDATNLHIHRDIHLNKRYDKLTVLYSKIVILIIVFAFHFKT